MEAAELQGRTGSADAVLTGPLSEPVLKLQELLLLAVEPPPPQGPGVPRRLVLPKWALLTD